MNDIETQDTAQTAGRRAPASGSQNQVPARVKAFQGCICAIVDLPPKEARIVLRAVEAILPSDSEND